jgi:hypothetical protein
MKCGLTEGKGDSRPRLLFLRHRAGSNDNKVRGMYKEHQNTVIEVPTKLKAVTLWVSEITTKKITQHIAEVETICRHRVFERVRQYCVYYICSSVRTRGIAGVMTVNSIICKLHD